MSKKFPLLTRVILIIVIPLLVVLGLIVHQLRSALPEQDTQLLQGDVSSNPVAHILRDEQGVPHIEAGNDREVFYALGYAHAQDRLWQLERQRRIAQGRLSELFGQGMVKQDAWFRTLGLYRAAQAAVPALSAEARDSLDAYAEGINAWIGSHPTLPVEFTALGIKPEPWTPADSLAWIKVFSLNLSGNFSEEIERYISNQYLSKEEMTFLYRDRGQGQPVIVDTQAQARAKALTSVMGLTQSVQDELHLGGKWLGSNAWAVAGRLSTDGHAILANDPHLGLSMPSWWYPVVLKGSRLRSSGMSLVGLPIVVLGRNADLAWAATSMTADVQDLYFETTDTRRPGQYLSNGQWENFASRTESIQVRSDFPSSLRPPLQPVDIRVRSTRHGPVITDSETALDATASLRWVALDPGDTTYEALLKLNYAQDWATFQSALALFVSPAMNFLYADTKGNIGYLGAGRIPIRQQGEGSLPVAGETDAYAWKGYIPASEMPRSYNPPSGYLVSANNRVVGPEYPYFISNDWAPPGRAQRITQLLDLYKANGTGIGIESHQKIQLDVLSLPAVKMQAVLKKVEGRTARQQSALKYIEQWDGQMAMDSQAASIFNVWMRHLATQLYGKRIKAPWNSKGHNTYLNALMARTTTDDLYASLTEPASPWCDQAQSPLPCADALSRSLDAALDELGKLKGDDMSNWKWGEIQRAFYEHIPFSNVKPLNALFERKVGTPGSTDTINIAYSVFKNSEGYLKYSGAGFRQIMQMGPEHSEHVYMNSTGQSGNVLSPHYADMVVPFEQGHYVKLDDAEPSAR